MGTGVCNTWDKCKTLYSCILDANFYYYMLLISMNIQYYHYWKLNSQNIDDNKNNQNCAEKVELIYKDMCYKLTIWGTANIKWISITWKAPDSMENIFSGVNIEIGTMSVCGCMITRVDTILKVAVGKFIGNNWRTWLWGTSELLRVEREANKESYNEQDRPRGSSVPCH